jgi:hypothetical protein
MAGGRRRVGLTSSSTWRSSSMWHGVIVVVHAAWGSPITSTWRGGGRRRGHGVGSSSSPTRLGSG